MKHLLALSRLLFCAPSFLALTLTNACSSGDFPVDREGTLQDNLSAGDACTSAGAAKCVSGTYCAFANGTCGANGASGVCTAIPQGDTTQYEPVCGCDGKNYENPGEAAIAGISVAAAGVCASTTTACAIADVATCAAGTYCDFANYTCGANGAPGVCTAIPQSDTAQYEPVCGCDGKNYENPGEAAIAGISVAAAGVCASTPNEDAGSEGTDSAAPSP